MPAINVARTDTFETQRQKINQIGDQIFNISQGGSDLATGNLKLGDGTRIAPSLAFTTDASLGIYKTTDSEFGYVYNGKELLNIGIEGINLFKNLNLQRRFLYTEGLTTLNPGQNYDPGSYSSILLNGGTGNDASLDITVTEFVGTITNSGVGYFPGEYQGVVLTGGSGSGATVSFDVDGIEGNITNAGSGYIPGSYSNIPLAGGSGNGATADLEILGSSELTGTITNSGSGYTNGSYQLVGFFNTPTTTFVVTTTSNPGTPPPDNVYVIDGNVQQVLSLEKGNTYRFDTSDASMVGHPLVFDFGGNALPGAEFVTRQSSAQLGTPGSFIDLIIKPNASFSTIQYRCSVHSGMGASINITTGTTGSYGSGANANITVSGGSVSIDSWGTAGNGYQNGDVLTIDTLGGTGSGFSFTVSGIAYTGVIDTFTIVESGSGYVNGDILGINNADVGGSGSNFAFTINNNPGRIDEVIFFSKGIGYQTNDVLELPKSTSRSSVTLRGRVQGVSTTLSISSATITIADTDGIIAGMQVTADLNQPGQVAQGTTVQSVDSSTQITLSANPTSDGSALLTFQSPGSLTGITVSSTTGISNGYRVFVSSGSGVLDSNTVISGVNEQTNEIIISPQPIKAGVVDLLITPPFGDPTVDFQYVVGNLGVVSDYSISYGGSGYIIGDNLSVNPSDLTQPEEIDVISREVVEISFSNTISSGVFSVGDTIRNRDGEIESFSTGNTTSIPAAAGNSYTGISASGGNGTGATFNAIRDQQGGISFTINSPGYFYQDSDVLTIQGSDIGGASPTDNVQITVSSASSSPSREVYKVNLDGSNNLSSLIVQSSSEELLVSGDQIYLDGTTTLYELDSNGSSGFRFFFVIDGGPQITPDLTFYVGNSYQFNLTSSSLSGITFLLSKFRDGIWDPSYIQNISTTLSTSSKQITVSSTAGIEEGMIVSQAQNPGDTGNISPSSFVESVDGPTTLTLSEFPDTDGTATLNFRGQEYSDGVEKESTTLTVKITENTPTLYYYSSTYQNMGGSDNVEASITIDPNNPKVFGSGFLVEASEINISDNINGNTETGVFECVTLNSETANVTEAIVTGSLTSPAISTTTLTTTTISATPQLTVNSPTTRFSGNVNIGTNIQISQSNGNITTSGILKTTGSFNVNDHITISDNIIGSTPTNDIVLSPATGQLTEIISNKALIIPVGDNLERPAFTPGNGDGAIRFNTETSQYEGYNSSTTSWSSLGGVRDIDGNTYILAELTAGANDNTLWFYNDGLNTLRLDREFLDFRNTKKISSGRLGLPSFTLWTANTPVLIGQFIKYRNNLYEVTGSGTTATVGNEPVHVSGALNNGTAQLTWYSSAVSPLTFTEIEELRVAPNKDAALVVNGGLKLGGTTSEDWNTISTLVEDLTIAPNPGKKVVIKSYTHLAIPAGNNNQKNTASAVPGSIRFNTEIQQFEGYSGTNWSSLGGVRDVDGNTYIIPETAPAANENILYFYNDNLNTMQLTRTSLDFTNIDTITTSGLSNLSIDTPLVTLNSNDTTIDNRDVDRTFISTSKQFLDLGLSSGLVVDPVLRLDDQGDVYLNTTFGSGTFNGVKVLDGQLKEFELADYAIRTTTFQLAKGGAETGSFVLYDSGSRKGCKVTVVSKSSSGKRSMTEYSVIDNGTDIFHNEFGSLNTSLDQYSASFDFNAINETRISLTLSNDHANGDIITFTILVQVIK